MNATNPVTPLPLLLPRWAVQALTRQLKVLLQAAARDAADKAKLEERAAATDAALDEVTLG